MTGTIFGGAYNCFDNPERGPVCKDGIRNQHFKFQKTMDYFNKHNDSLMILSENMLVIAEFTSIGKTLGGNVVTKDNLDSFIVSYRVCTPLSEIAEFSLKSWIDSPKHNQNLLHRTATRISYKIFRMKHYNLDWIHSVLILATLKGR